MKRGRKSTKDTKNKKQKIEEEEEVTEKKQKTTRSRKKQIVEPVRRSSRLQKEEPTTKEEDETEISIVKSKKSKKESKKETTKSEISELKRSNTLELIPDEEVTTSPVKVATLVRSNSSFKNLLNFNIDAIGGEALISSLSLKSQSILEKKLSQIFTNPTLPSVEEIITFTPFTRLDDEGEYEKSMDTTEEDEEDAFLSNLPSELIVFIFELLIDEERWQLAITCKRFLSIFKLYVGWNELLILHMNNLRQAKKYVEPAMIGTVSSEIQFLQPHSVVHAVRTYRNPNDVNLPENQLDQDSADLFDKRLKTAHRLKYHARPTGYDKDAVFFVYEKGENAHPTFAKRQKIFYHNLDGEYSMKKVIMCIPVSDISINAGDLEEFEKEEFLSLFIGKMNGIKKVNYCKSIFGGEVTGLLKGRDAAKHFVNAYATLHADRVSMRFTFNAKEFGRTISVNPDYKCCSLVKWIILQILKRSVVQKSRLIKWSKPFKSTMAIAPSLQPDGFNITLHDYQLRGLAWLKKIEESVFRRKYRFCAIHPAPGYPTCDFFLNSGPFDYDDSSNFELIREYDDISFESRPDLYDTYSVRGGIMADEMGLGKTLTMTSLLLARPRAKNAKGEYYLEEFDQRASAKFEVKASLIICPSQLVPQWEKEINDRTNNKLTVITVATINELRNITYQDVIDADVVITSHQFLFKNPNYVRISGPLETIQERSFKKSIELDDSPILQHFGWHRIILDEGHEVLSTGTDKIQRAEGKDLFNSFLSTYRWYVTGTPVPRGRDSLVGTLNFLDIKLKSGYLLDEEMDDEKVVYEMSLFDSAKKSLFWRNRKDEVNTQAEIPNTIENVILIHLTPIEKAIYDAAELAKDVKSMRMVCSQPKETPLLTAIFGSQSAVDLSRLGDKMVTHYQTTLIDSFTRLNQINTSIATQKKKMELLKMQLEFHDKKKPKNEESAEYVKWLMKHTKKEKTLQNLDTSILSLVRENDQIEQRLVLMVEQAACFSKAFDTNLTDLMKISHCAVCAGPLWVDRDHSPLIAHSCKHVYCFKCQEEYKVPIPAENTITKIPKKCTVEDCGFYGINFIPFTVNSPHSSSVSLHPFFDKLYGPSSDPLDHSDIIIEEDEDDENEDAMEDGNIINIEEDNKIEKNKNKKAEIKEKKNGDEKKKKVTEKKESKSEKRKKVINKLYETILSQYGSKLASLIDWTYKLLHSDSTAKVIVFSKSDDLLRNFALILQRYYRSEKKLGEAEEEESGETEEEISTNVCVTCKGNITIRKKMIEQFNSQSKNSPRVLLLSLSNAASGTHLTVASHIILADSVVGTKEEVKAADGQAIARAHRIGQEKKVIVVRFIVANSIEHKDYLKVYGSD